MLDRLTFCILVDLPHTDMYKKGWDRPLYILRVHMLKFPKKYVLQFYLSQHRAGPNDMPHLAVCINTVVLVKSICMYYDVYCNSLYSDDFCQ